MDPLLVGALLASDLEPAAEAGETVFDLQAQLAQFGDVLQPVPAICSLGSDAVFEAHLVAKREGGFLFALPTNAYANDVGGRAWGIRC